jgi:ribosome biogenesis protein BMS1
MPVEEKDQWQGLRSVGQLKRDMNIRNEPNIDSLYKPIERKERVFRPLQIPKQLQQDLPFHLKPKPTESITIKDPIEEKQRVAVILEPQEKKMNDIMKMFTTVYKDRLKTKQKAQTIRNNQYQKQQKIQELKRLQKHKQLKKLVYKKLGQMEPRKNKQNSRHGKQTNNDSIDE